MTRALTEAIGESLGCIIVLFGPLVIYIVVNWLRAVIRHIRAYRRWLNEHPQD